MARGKTLEVGEGPAARGGRDGGRDPRCRGPVFDAGDYPLRETPELQTDLISTSTRSSGQAVVLTPLAGRPPNNPDHPKAAEIALQARVLAQAPGVPGPGEVIGAPPVFCFEPHQSEVCGFVPDVVARRHHDPSGRPSSPR
jgi:LmbE family N-acetylglucosaminyl deacetylase